MNDFRTSMTFISFSCRYCCIFKCFMKHHLATILVVVRMLLQIYLCKSRSHHVATKIREAALNLLSQRPVRSIFDHLPWHYYPPCRIPFSRVDRKPQFVAGRIIRGVCPLRCNCAKRTRWFHINLKIIDSVF